MAQKIAQRVRTQRYRVTRNGVNKIMRSEAAASSTKCRTTSQKEMGREKVVDGLKERYVKYWLTQ